MTLASNKNIFYATNPARIVDALWQLVTAPGAALQNTLIFVPSTRAARTVAQYILEKSGATAVILPRIVPLGDGIDDDDTPPVDATYRLLMMAKLLAADANIGTIGAALPIARDFLRMSDYLENEGVDISTVQWDTLVDEKYAAHFQAKAAILRILGVAGAALNNNQPTQTAARNAGIRAWINHINEYERVIVCASTASVPATADLMAAVAGAPHGRIILPGKISGRDADFELDTNPYNAEYKFLKRIGCGIADITPIDVGPSAIDFMNVAFGNDCTAHADAHAVRHCHMVECTRESEEAAAAAEIAHRALRENKSVLVVTPDAAGNQRIANAFAARGITADFSGGRPGTMTATGRAILNMMDTWIERGENEFDRRYRDADYDLMQMIINAVDGGDVTFAPAFEITDAIDIWWAIKKLSDAARALNLHLGAADARAVLADTIGAVTVRDTAPGDARVSVVGTIESRMQTADTVILTGLNDGMFPARGYENAWLPRAVADKIGIPPANRKVSLQSLDFMNLSCGGNVYWTRSLFSGTTTTCASRFISRVIVRGGEFDRDAGRDILSAVRNMDAPAPHPLNRAAPTPPADWSDVYATELELLAHNPYAFYVRHILRLRVMDDYWVGPDMRAFGTLVHNVIENTNDFSVPKLVHDMDAAARAILPENGILFNFWHRRFTDIAPVICEYMRTATGMPELEGHTHIAGRTVRARADRVWDGGVMDIKTGAAPTKSQLTSGNMPQLGLEAYILQHGGFPIATTHKSLMPEITFLQLKSGDARTITYDGDDAQMIIDGAVTRTTEMFNIFSAGRAPYEYRETNNQKYRAYDDLARIRDDD